MKRFVAFVLVAGLACGPALSAPLGAQPRRPVTIASGSVDGVYYPIAGAISRIASDARGLNVRATVESSGGSLANVQLIRAGEADFALLQNDVAYYAFNGITLSVFAGKPVKTMTGVFTVYSELVHVVATKELGAKSVRDLKGRRVVLGPPGSSVEQNALQILGAHGIREVDLRAAVRIPAAAALDQLKAGLVDAAFFTTALGSPLIVDALGSDTLVLVGLGNTAGESLRRQYPFYTIERIPANAYEGHAQEVAAAGMKALLVARSGLSEDLVYRFTRAVFENLPQFHAAHPAARNLTLQTALAGMALPLHPGAERFFKEKGIAR